jgi:hypothetical protein
MQLLSGSAAVPGVRARVASGCSLGQSAEVMVPALERTGALLSIGQAGVGQAQQRSVWLLDQVDPEVGRCVGRRRGDILKPRRRREGMSEACSAGPAGGSKRRSAVPFGVRTVDYEQAEADRFIGLPMCYLARHGIWWQVSQVIDVTGGCCLIAMRPSSLA